MREEELSESFSEGSRSGGFDGVNPHATDVLRRNGLKSWTKPAPSLYPHQWSWDSAFIALGLAHVDNRRATDELDTLFTGQWSTGKVPHIVFNPEAPPKSYFPDAERWNSSALSEDAPSGPRTSGLCQPPVHAIAVRRIWQTARRKDEERVARARSFLSGNYRRLFAWHRYLATARDPEGSGLVTIYHPWESGTDNSPRWDAVLDRISIGEVPSYTRYDLEHVTDPSHRPTDSEYDRYLWLLELLKRARYDEADIYERHPFLVKDVLFSAILVAANEALLEISEVLEAPREERELIERWIERGREGLDEQWDPHLGLYVDHDLLADVGNPDLRHPLPPSTSPEEPGFHPRSYWRGPVWPVANWLLWWSLLRAGESGRAQMMRRETLEELSEGGFAEYFEPFTGVALGSKEQSWTAAVALDMLATGGAD
jgi:glucosylglycerate hydrolase